AATDISGGEVYYHDRAKVSLAEVASVSRAFKRRHGLALVVLDYLQLMEVKGENRATALGEVSAGLKQLARQLDVPVIALAQLNREVEKRPGGRPRLADLRESGSLEQDADSVWLMWRPELYLKDDAAKGKVEIHVAKNRSGRTGSVWLRWHGPTT